MSDPDRELLEWAAKAAGMHANEWADAGELLPDKGGFVQFFGLGLVVIWNPLTDDGDALRLAVKLCIDIAFPRDGDGGVIANLEWQGFAGSDPLAATRRVITRAAADIGRRKA